MTINRRRCLVALAASVLPSAATPQSDAPLIALRSGGGALLLRHAATEPGVGDPPGFRLGNCSTQRNLSASGREQAARIGRTLAAAGVRVGEVLSSEWCRCIDTARLAFPDVKVVSFPPLNSFFGDRSREPEQTRRVLERIAAVKPPATVVLVTHNVNIFALTRVSVAAGDGVVMRPAGGSAEVVGRIAL